MNSVNSLINSFWHFMIQININRMPNSHFKSFLPWKYTHTQIILLPVTLVHFLFFTWWRLFEFVHPQFLPLNPTSLRLSEWRNSPRSGTQCFLFVLLFLDFMCHCESLGFGVCLKYSLVFTMCAYCCVSSWAVFTLVLLCLSAPSSSVH